MTQSHPVHLQHTHSSLTTVLPQQTHYNTLNTVKSAGTYSFGNTPLSECNPCSAISELLKDSHNNKMYHRRINNQGMTYENGRIQVTT